MNTTLRPLVWAAYAVALLLIIMPLVELVLGIWPLRVGQLNWRFGAAGLVSQSVMTPLLGMFLAVATAAAMGHRMLARILSGVAIGAGVLGILAIGMFALDALEARASVRPEAMMAFDRATLVAILRYSLGTITAFLLGIGGWKASRKGRSAAAAASAPASRTAADDSRVLIGAKSKDG